MAEHPKMHSVPADTSRTASRDEMAFTTYLRFVGTTLVCVCILYHSPTLKYHRRFKSFLMDDKDPGPLLNIKTVFPRYGDSHVKDKTAVRTSYWCAILIAHQIVMAKHGGSCVHFSGISTCGRTSRETVSHSQRQPLPTPHKIALPVYVTVTNKRLQPLTTTLYNSLVPYFSLLTTKRRLIKHRSFLRVLRSS